jgi:restriction endonuclease S subunit
MKYFYKNIIDISKHKFLRNDVKYWLTIDQYQFSNYFKMKDLFSFINGSVQTENYSLVITNIPYIRIGDLSYKFGVSNADIIYLKDDTELTESKILKENDLILATIGSVGKICLAGKYAGGTFSNNTTVLRIKDLSDSIEFYEKLFQTDSYRKYIYGVAAQKGQPNLQQYDLENIKIPNIRSELKNEAILSIKPIEEKIIFLQSNLDSLQGIIDGVMQKKFHFDYGEFNELNKIKIFMRNEYDFSNNHDLRFSAKFHRPAGDFVMKELLRITDKKIKNYLSEPILLGASVSPLDFDENGNTYYISMATIKSFNVELDETQLLSNNYVEQHSDKKIKKNDIILNRSGVAIGKVALVNDDINGIFADFTMRIRLKNYNPQFAYYYMRGSYFQYLIEIYKKGLQNQNIFPIVIQEFPLPDLSLDEQQSIVDEIQVEIDKQNEIKNHIDDLRKEIDKIIENTIKVS